LKKAKPLPQKLSNQVRLLITLLGKPAVWVKDYKTGDFFGELALIKGDPRAANIIAKTNLKLISLDRNSFKRLLGPLDDILMRNSEKYIKFIKK
jgi:cAMP-dependent protein kinase regulator